MSEVADEEEKLLGSTTTTVLNTLPRRELFPRYQKSIAILKDLILLALAIPTLITLFRQAVHHIHPSDPRHSEYKPGEALPGCNCGNSVAQALQLNCKYDTLAAAWLPPHCIDAELTALFDRSGDGPNGTWTYWADQKHTKEIPVEDLGALADEPEGGTFYSTHRWHLVHCFFYWRKAIRSKTIGVTLEERYDTESHAVHCSRMMDADSSRGSVSGVALNSNRWDAM